MSEIRHETKIRVRYAETDQMRVVYYGRYFEYFEQARTEMLRRLGLPYSELEHQGVLLPVIEASARYRQSVHYDDLITIETILREVPVARIRLEYRVFREGDPEPVVEGFTVHSFLNATTRRPTRAPAQLVQLIQDSLSQQ
jgi:acyl-CoA thioester hydrolase